MKRRRLSTGEGALWKRVTRDVRALGASSPQRPAGIPVGETTREAMTPVAATTKSKARPARVAKVLPAAPATTVRKKRATKVSAFASGDPGVERRVKRGGIEVERTLDLHGLREAGARRRLESFLVGAARDGCRCVLVITGKGAAQTGRDPLSEKKPRGVIRMRFKEWIDEAPLRALITRVAPARPKDGGAGAFYVFLKRKV